MAKQLSKGPLGQLIWTQETFDFEIFVRFTSFVKIATLFTWTPFAKTWEFNICQTLANSQQICYSRHVLYFWTYLVLTKSPSTDTPTVLGNFSERLSTVFQALTEARLKQKKLASSTELGKRIYHRFILLPFCYHFAQDRRPELLIHFLSHTELLQLNFPKQPPVISGRHPLLSGQYSKVLK